MGVRYVHGEGVAKDEVEAYAYWSLASDGSDDAGKNLAILEKKLSLPRIALGKKRTIELQGEMDARMASK
jgi:TPR repeat protein